MKRLLLAASFGILSLSLVKAQDLETIKKQMLLRQYKAAKASVDKAVTVEKLAKKPEVWAMKVSIYSALADDSATRKNPEQFNVLFNEAANAFKKYKELDPKLELMKDNTYTGGPINLYSSIRNVAFDNFNAKNWDLAHINFVTAIDYSEFLINSKIWGAKMDTISIVYAGASAQNNKNDEAAVKYFTRLADDKIAGPDYEFFYQFLTNYYYQKKDDAYFGKFSALGKSFYPESKYFRDIQEDYANSKDMYLISMNEGGELFDKRYPKNEKDSVQGDITDLENKMIAAYNKAAETKPEKAGLPFTGIGNHFYNKAIGVNKKLNDLSKEISLINKTSKPDKKGKFPPLPKLLSDKRLTLNNEYAANIDLAIANYEKAALAFGKKDKLENIEKQSYKNAVSFLIDLNGEKKRTFAKSKPAESAKFAAMEKKWTDVYSNIK